MTRERSARDLWAIVGVAAVLPPILPLGAAWCLPQLRLQPVPDAGTDTDASDAGNACPDQSSTMCDATLVPSGVASGRRPEMPTLAASRRQNTTLRDRKRVADRPVPILIRSEGGVRHAVFSLS